MLSDVTVISTHEIRSSLEQKDDGASIVLITEGFETESFSFLLQVLLASEYISILLHNWCNLADYKVYTDHHFSERIPRNTNF